MTDKLPAFHHFDPVALRDDLMDDGTLTREILQRALTWQQETIGKLQTSTDDRLAQGKLAHSLRGMLAQIHAHPAAALASTLEHACKSEGTPLDTPRQQLIAAVDQLSAELETYLGHTPAS